MSCSIISFKRKWCLFSLLVLASLVDPHMGFAMDVDTESSKKRKREEDNEPNKKQRTEQESAQHPIASTSTSLSIEFPPLKDQSLTLEKVTALVLKAKTNDEIAQNELMKIRFRGLYVKFLTPDNIGFLSWQGQSSDDTIENRCYRDDIYAFFVVAHFQTIGAHFPNLFETIKRRADQEDAHAQRNLGFMYAKGIGVEKDEKEAYKYYKLAADQGHANAQCNLGIKYAYGRGVEKDEKEAFRYYKLAADQGHARAQCNLGYSYANGQGIEKDEKEALRYYKLAAHQGHAGAQCSVGAMYEDGQGVEKDEKKAFMYYKLAAKQGNADAQYNLGLMYEEGTGVEKDEKEAFRYCKLAADQEHADAQDLLGIMYEHGIGVEKNEKEAFRYYKLAADQGNVDAQYNLGCMYANGEGLEKNLIEALHWYVQSKDEKSKGLIRKHLPRTPNILLTGGSFQEMLVDIMQGKTTNDGEEGGLAFLLKKFQLKIGTNKQNSFGESHFAIPELGKMYEPVEAIVAEAMGMMQSLSTIKPGFMVTVVSLSEEMKAELPNQITQFFSLEKIDDIAYLTIGEKNIPIVNRFRTFLDKLDGGFTQADQALERIAQLYQQGIDSSLGDLIVKQRFAHTLTDQTYIQNDDGSSVMVKEHFGSVVSKTDAFKAFSEQEKKFTDLKNYLKLPLKEIEEERSLLRELKEKIKSLPVRGLGSRNQDCLEEYPLLQ